MFHHKKQSYLRLFLVFEKSQSHDIISQQKPSGLHEKPEGIILLVLFHRYGAFVAYAGVLCGNDSSAFFKTLNKTVLVHACNLRLRRSPGNLAHCALEVEIGGFSCLNGEL